MKTIISHGLYNKAVADWKNCVPADADRQGLLVFSGYSAIAVGLAERHVSRQLRLAYLAPAVLKRLVYGREGPAVTVLDLSDCAALPWAEQAGEVFGGE